MLACVLCLVCSDGGYPLLSAEGVRLNIKETINRHFSFFEVLTADGDAAVCRECWQCISSFDEFHQRVSRLHQEPGRDDSKSVAIEFCAETEEAINPLFDVELDALAEGFFDPNEVKVEVNELPKVELLEDPVNTERKKGATKRRGSQAEGLSKPKRRIKNEKIVDSDSDVPLAKFVGAGIKTGTNGPAGINEQSKGQPRSTRRGRPPKAKPVTLASPKKELEADEEDHDVNFLDFLTADPVSGTEDSSSSSSESSDDDSDYSLPVERYAKIPKRVVVKPKKYRKREKPLVPPNRMSREEIEQRKQQQEVYDKIILQFFKNFSCHICNLLVQNLSDMRLHQRDAHNIKSGYIQCCGKKFHRRKILAEHVLVHKNPEHFMCSHCGRVFPDSRSLEVHEQTHTNPEKPMFHCEKCPRSFTSKMSLEYHSIARHVPKSEFKYSCPECNKKIPTKRKLNEHLRHKHNPETAIICDKCGKTLPPKSSLKKHHELEHSEQPHPKPDPVQCEICGAWLKNPSGLKKHMSTVHEPKDKEHRCPICNKTSVNSTSLKRHIRHNHQCERKFKCGLCEKAFKRPMDLREHTSTHTGEVLYTCPNCPMTFFSNANMYKHRQRLHRAEWEADRKKPLPPNIMKLSQGATTVGTESIEITFSYLPQL